MSNDVLYPGQPPSAMSELTEFTGQFVAPDTLRDILAPCEPSLTTMGMAIRFVPDVCAEIDAGHPLALLPAFNELHSSMISSMTAEHPGAVLVGVVSDITGMQTYQAIRSGATGVLNIVLPPATAADALEQVRRNRIPGTPPAIGADAPEKQSVEIGDEDVDLVRMLLSEKPTSEIARHFYCSERTMYRRLRDLYRKIGARGRNDVRRLAGRGLLRSAD
ncbi:DNA-binding NarL/FixJ family response regulator [Crossiella equi]|uniref:DNA-binding NarL/FixJ family response regulator n=1 Tax=Crossiella equi TaxID=130796 RepID=A0ABS5ABN1_9PSEU|nr:hypothetical protein [Crossiella equi]MBP2473986.1 DNA-binding NarL/FixJ family response regulator [Crossiella equi]